MKRFLLSVLVFFVFVGTAQAQWVIEAFNTAVKDTTFDFYTVDWNPANNGYVKLTDSATDPKYGPADMTADWRIKSTESWGSFLELYYTVPREDSAFMDISFATHLSLWFNNRTPSSKPGTVSFRFTLHDGASGNYWGNRDQREDWIYETTAVFDATPGWTQLLIPLVDRGRGPSPNEQGFSLPDWAFGEKHNNVLDLDKIVGYSLIWTTPGIAGDSSSTGLISFDKLETWGARYPVVQTQDRAAADTFWTVSSWGEWDQPEIKNTILLSDNTTNVFEGAGALQLNWHVRTPGHDGPSWWGGGSWLEHIAPTGTHLQDLSANTALLMWYKVVSAVPSLDASKMQLRVNLFDDSDGAEEQWYHLTQVKLDSVTPDWTLLRIPLEQLPLNIDPTPDGFTLPSWEGYKGNGVLDYNKLTRVKFEITGGGEFLEADGVLLFDYLLPTGFRETDKTAPVPPASILGVAGTFVNLVTWLDVPGETEERYDVYYSESPITDVNAPGVEVVKLRIPENTQVVEHVLRAPLTNQPVTYYYAVTCTDKPGNISQPGISAATVTNIARGVPTISLTPPANFAADGDLSEWSAITPFRIFPSDGSGTVVTNTKIEGDVDLSVLSYVAIDQTYLYVAFDVEDDVVQVDTTQADSYQQDSPDLFIGLYDWRGKVYSGYRRGATPDYHLRFSENMVHMDNLSNYVLLRPGANYSWFRKFPTGYTVEAKIPLSVIAASGNDDVFAPKEGMRILIDYAINDNDDPVTRREGILTYSPANQDQSWNDVSRWTYTWIGSRWAVGVQDQKPERVTSYALYQNHPNPFNPTTQIAYSLEKAGLVSLKVFDVLGRNVATLVQGYKPAGAHTVSFNAAQLGASFGNGVYFYQIEAGAFKSTRKMIYMK